MNEAERVIVRPGRAATPLRKGVYLLPNLITTAGLFAGFYSIICCLRADFLWAAIAIIVANVFDALDGRVARLTNSTSRFGIEYDSLADLVAFGVAPGILVYPLGAGAVDDLGVAGGIAVRRLRRAASGTLQRAVRQRREAPLHRPADSRGRRGDRDDRPALLPLRWRGSDVTSTPSSCSSPTRSPG